ncbi:MAG: PfkB family carbohydrate kinase [Candidatus Omnitrophica bacterium]|nr:PfkB family carbohydrate kinase [Candidatus Omnitrophota bacterium]
MSILVVGSIALDTVKTPYGLSKDILGGSATYFSISASFFSPVKLVAIVGTDFPSKYIKIFKKRKIDLKGLTIKEGKTFRWQAEYSDDLNKVTTISTQLNVFSDFRPKILDEYKKAKFVFLANIDPKLQDYILSQVKSPQLVAADTMSHWIKEDTKDLINFLKKVDIFFLNDTEARLLTGENNLLKAAKSILKFGPKRIIIKKGEHGSMMVSNDSIFCLPSFLLEKVYDPTGAGDTFAGGLMGYLAMKRKINEEILRKALAYGTVMATFVIEDFSLKKLLKITRYDIKNRLKEFCNLVKFDYDRL